jgi:hypothetical protein
MGILGFTETARDDRVAQGVTGGRLCSTFPIEGRAEGGAVEREDGSLEGMTPESQRFLQVVSWAEPVIAFTVVLFVGLVSRQPSLDRLGG